MDLFELVFSRNEIKEKPPVLIDIGASGEIHKDWEKIAKYSIGIAFDADKREMEYINEESGFKELYVYNKIVVDQKSDESDFYLTSSPFCSSTLKPDLENLNKWSFKNLFEIDKKVKVKSTRVNDILTELKFDYIDWFKTDSQGTDLRLFKSIGGEIIEKVIIAEFEPGILDAYIGEDKLIDVFNYMNSKPFWIMDLNIFEVERINKDIVMKPFFSQDKWYSFEYRKEIFKGSPGWANICYFNEITKNIKLSLREYLLSITFAYIKQQYTYALELAIYGYNKFNDKVFKEIQIFIIQQINNVIMEKKNPKKNKYSFYKRVVSKLKRILKIN
jgi:hypothetical protein